MTERELKIMLDQAERSGIEKGIKIMQQRMLLACENGTPIEIDGKAYFINDAISNLRGIFSDLEADARCKELNEGLEILKLDTSPLGSDVIEETFWQK